MKQPAGKKKSLARHRGEFAAEDNRRSAGLPPNGSSDRHARQMVVVLKRDRTEADFIGDTFNAWQWGVIHAKLLP
ncbi:MAG: hypothetical protein ACLQNE_28065 [Thermoguttaceae bacterium]